MMAGLLAVTAPSCHRLLPGRKVQNLETSCFDLVLGDRVFGLLEKPQGRERLMTG
jgi:hypothetical protein